MRAVLWRRGFDVALVAAALLLVGLVIATSRSVTTGEAAARERHVLAAFREDELTRIVIERGKERVVLEREVSPPPSSPASAGDESAASEPVLWHIVEPRREPAGPFEVDAFLTALDQATVVRRIAPDQVDRDAMGLDQPRSVVTVVMGPIHYRLVIGADAVTPDGAAYVDVSGEGVRRPGVVVVRKETVEQIAVGVDDLREAKLVPYLSDALRTIELDGLGGRRQLRRVGARWQFAGMLHERRVDRRLLSSLFVQLVGLSAEQPIATPTARRLLDAASDRVQLTLRPSDDRPVAVLVVGGQCPRDPTQVVALRREPDPLAGCAPRDLWRLLGTPPEQMLARRLFSIDTDEVELLQIKGPERRLELVRRESGFLLREPQAAEVELETGNRRLATIVEARGELLDSADRVALGLEPARTTVRLTTSGADESEVIEERIVVGEPDAEGAVAVLRRTDGAVLRVDRTVARALTPDATLIRPRTLFDHDVKSLRRITVSGSTTQELVQAADGSLRLVRPPGFSVDASLARDLLATLARLEANRWEADVDDGSFGLEAPEVEIEMVVEGEASESIAHRLAVGAATTGGFFASLAEQPGVFVLGRRDRAIFERLLIDRSVFRIDLEHVTRLRFRTARADVELGRVGGSFEYRSGEPRVAAGTVARLVAALGELHPEVALHVGAAGGEEGFGDPVLVVSVAGDAGYEGPDELRFGAGDSWQGTSVHYARVAGVDATYVMARSLVHSITDSL